MSFCFFFFNFPSSEMTIHYLSNNDKTNKMPYPSYIALCSDTTLGVVKLCLLAVFGVLSLAGGGLMTHRAQAACFLLSWKETDTSLGPGVEGHIFVLCPPYGQGQGVGCGC